MLIKLYQPNNPTFHVLEGQKFNKKDYHKVYTFEDDCEHSKENDDEILNTLFTLLNMDEKPEGYTGHSMSVEDVVAIDNRLYVCESVGFSEIKWEDQ